MLRTPFVARFAPAWSLIAILAIMAAKPPDPWAPVVVEPQPPKRPPVVAAWLRSGSGGTLRPLVMTIAAHARFYDEISAFSYTIERDGSLTANAPVTDSSLVDFARASGIRVIPTISSTWDSTYLVRILRDPQLTANHLNAILAVARSPLVDGIDLDYENLPPESRQPFTDFVTSLGVLLHREGKVLTVTVPPKVTDEDACIICRFADYASLGLIADQIRIMAYEFHGKNGGPGANAPIWWIRQVVSYAVSRVPSEKIILGVHLYAYDWGGKETPAMWWTDVQALKNKYKGEVRFVESDERGMVGESILTYAIPGPRCPRHTLECEPPLPEKHTVWFVDARYVSAAWSVVDEYRLGGIVMWRPGGEDPAIWDVFRHPPARLKNW